MSDLAWCRTNGIQTSSFYSAVKRLREKSFMIPSRQDDDIYVFATHTQDVLKVDIVGDIKPNQDFVPATAKNLDNSHTIEIIFGNVNIRISNEANPVLLFKTLRILGGMQ